MTPSCVVPCVRYIDAGTHVGTIQKACTSETVRQMNPSNHRNQGSNRGYKHSPDLQPAVLKIACLVPDSSVLLHDSFQHTTTPYTALSGRYMNACTAMHSSLTIDDMPASLSLPSHHNHITTTILKRHPCPKTADEAGLRHPAVDPAPHHHHHRWEPGRCTSIMTLLVP
jgi:hypothetical protein